jgi:hypothetical protein
MSEEDSHMVSWQQMASNNHQSINIDHDRGKEDETNDFTGASIFG